MRRYSYKVNKRRDLRERKRRSVRFLITTNTNYSNDSDENSSLGDPSDPRSSSNQSFDHNPSETSCDDSPIVSSSRNFNHDGMKRDTAADDDAEDQYLDMDDQECLSDDRPLYIGSSVKVQTAIHRITDFCLEANLDKQKVTSLLRLIESLLPKPNALPLTWKGMERSSKHISNHSITFLCADCNQPCSSIRGSRNDCVNPSCTSSFRQRRSTELIEIVRFDIRSQIQSVMNRNVQLINKSHLFPPSDTCFGRHYRRISSNDINRITLAIHTDGAPLVRSSKQSIWPCFASIIELPPPVREY